MKGSLHGLARRALSRFFDVVFAAVGLLLLCRYWRWLALVIVLRDGRPVLFGQMRMGRYGRQFRIWKFRTMRTGTPGSAITAAGDRRVTSPECGCEDSNSTNCRNL